MWVLIRKNTKCSAEENKKRFKRTDPSFLLISDSCTVS